MDVLLVSDDLSVYQVCPDLFSRKLPPQTIHEHTFESLRIRLKNRFSVRPEVLHHDSVLLALNMLPVCLLIIALMLANLAVPLQLLELTVLHLLRNNFALLLRLFDHQKYDVIDNKVVTIVNVKIFKNKNIEK